MAKTVKRRPQIAKPFSIPQRPPLWKTPPLKLQEETAEIIPHAMACHTKYIIIIRFVMTAKVKRENKIVRYIYPGSCSGD